MVKIDKKLETLKDLFGKKCCRCKIDRFGGLVLGFGEKVEHNNPKLSDSFRGEWEVVIFEPSWELSINGKTYKNDLKSDIQNILNKIIGQKILGFNQNNWAVILENAIIFRVNKDEFDIDDEDSYMHVFNMNNNVHSFKCAPSEENDVTDH